MITTPLKWAGLMIAGVAVKNVLTTKSVDKGLAQTRDDGKAVYAWGRAQVRKGVDAFHAKLDRKEAAKKAE